MNDGLLVGMLNGFAHADEEREAFRNVEALLVAVRGDGRAFDILHDKVGLTGRGCSSVEHLGDARMLHDRERLLFRLKTLEDGLIVKAGANELHGHATTYRS